MRLPEAYVFYKLHGRTIGWSNSTTLRYLLADHLHSTHAEVGSAATELSQRRNFPFGSDRPVLGASDLTTDERYTSQRRVDHGNGNPKRELFSYRARWYLPGVGIFTQPDPVVPHVLNPQSLNRYAYVLNNPLRHTDPSGLQDDDDGDRDDEEEGSTDDSEDGRDDSSSSAAQDETARDTEPYVEEQEEQVERRSVAADWALIDQTVAEAEAAREAAASQQKLQELFSGIVTDVAPYEGVVYVEGPARAVVERVAGEGGAITLSSNLTLATDSMSPELAAHKKSA